MRNKDSIILKKILEYCDQVSEACEMFGNDYDKFINISVFQNACCMCILQVGELCKVVSEELKEQNQMQWVRMMNNIRLTAEETVLKELIYS